MINIPFYVFFLLIKVPNLSLWQEFESSWRPDCKYVDYISFFVFQFQIFPRDKGANPREGERATVRVTVDKNTPPGFDRNVYNYTVNQNVPVGTVLLPVTATDNDQNVSVLAQRIKCDMFHVNWSYKYQYYNIEVYVVSIFWGITRWMCDCELVWLKALVIQYVYALIVMVWV